VLTAQHGGGVQPTQAIANTVGAAIKAAFTSSTLNTYIHNGTSLTKVGLRWIGAPAYPEYEDSGAAVVGAASANALPKQVALVATIRTGFVGKSYRGRMYIGGWGVIANDPTGVASAAAMAAAQAFAVAVQTALAGSGYVLGVGSRAQYAMPLADPPVQTKAAFFNPATSILVRDSMWDTQRRRLK